jgi:hypothetical protein
MPTEQRSYLPVVFSQGGGAEFPTGDGRRLRIAGGLVKGEVAVWNETRLAEQAGDDEDGFADLPTDVLAAELRLADSEGQVWAATARFSADRLLARWIDLSYANSGPQREPKPKRGSKSIFGSPAALGEVMCSSDDRSYRYITLDGKAVVSFKFEYTVMAFDLVLVSEDDEAEVWVRLRPECLFDEKTRKDLGGWIFPIHWLELFRSNTRVPAPGGGWQENALPLPLTFHRVDATGSPQAAVSVT